MYIKNSFFIAVVVVALAALSCQKVATDKIPPLLYLKGNNPDTMLLGCQYPDTGGYWLIYDDDRIPMPDVYIDHPLFYDSVGTYYIHYTAIDIDSNRAYATRKVEVIAKSVQNYLGKYMAYDTLAPLGEVQPTYQVETSLVGQSNSLVRISNFMNFGEDFEVRFDYDSTNFFNINYNAADTIIQGNGTFYCNSSGFRIVYTVNVPDQDTEYHRTTFRK
ncbi:MAG: immunoglobulin-like domain-containing protein [Bacteroidales bacterium]